MFNIVNRFIYFFLIAGKFHNKNSGSSQDVTAPKGSFFAWLPVPDGFTSQSFADYLLDAADVAVAPGNGFGKYGEGFIRVGLLMDEARLVEAVQRIGNLGVFKNK